MSQTTRNPTRVYIWLRGRKLTASRYAHVAFGENHLTATPTQIAQNRSRPSWVRHCCFSRDGAHLLILNVYGTSGEVLAGFEQR